jgi:hydroxymethylglutaryl-CoA reductase (NADPH)
MNFREYTSVAKRREALETKLQINLSNLGNFSLDEKEASSKNCENMIGAAQIPMGVAGPLQIQSSISSPRGTPRVDAGEAGKLQSYFLPLATTEGALVASVNRGCKVIAESGGVSVFAEKMGTTRGPVFYTGSLAKSKKLSEWIKKNESLLKKTAESTSSHLKYKKLVVSMLSDYVFVRFSFDTEDAMGMNMATIATQRIAEVIEKETGIECLSVAGNFDIDKKPAWLNFINNRGVAAWAEIVVKKDVVEKILKTTPEKIFDVWLSKCMIGSAMSGSLGFNSHFANIIAAIFLATGQDPAHVVEGSMGITTVKVLKNGDLFFAIYLPALMIGTVGGGTNLATQKEALQILGVWGNGKAQKFAEIIAGAVLAGEISLLASLAEGSLAKAHERLGRGK